MPPVGGVPKLLPAPKARAAAPSPNLLKLAHATPSLPRAISRTVRTTHYTPVRHGGSDVQSSGAGYPGLRSGRSQVAAYKQSAAFKRAVVETFLHQPDPQKAAILHGALAGASLEGDTILRYLRSTNPDVSFSLRGGKVVGQAHAPGSAVNVGSLADQGLAGAANVLSSLGSTQLNRQANVQLGGLTPSSVTQVLTHAPIDVARAGLQDPSVVPKTVAGLADTVAGTVAGTIELPYRVVTQGPGKALSSLGSAIGADYSRRYGALTAGNDQAFINRIKKEGAGPELFDALVAAGGLDATAGKALASLGKVRAELTGEEGFLTRARPDLRLSGNKVRSQQLASTAGRITAQRLEDRLRAMRTARQPGELRPAEGQVAPIFQSHAIRVVHSGIAQGWRRVMQDTLQKEVRGRTSSARTAIGRLNTWQRKAIFHAVHGFRVDTPAHFRADLATRYRQIVEDRANPASLGNRIPAQFADQVDELKLIDQLSAHADQIAGPQMVAFQRAEATRAQRIEGATVLHPATAEARRLSAQADLFGVAHPDIAAAEELARLRAREKSVANLVRRPGTVGELHSARAELQRVQKQIARLKGGEGRTERLAAYNARVRAIAKERGYPEPGYFKHTEHPETKFGDFASGSGQRAMPADRQSTRALYRAGVAHHEPDAYLQGLARAIKRPFQWRLTDEQFRTAALPTPTRDEIQAALGRNKAPHLLTGHELRRVLSHRGDDLKQLAFYNPGRLSAQTLADHGLLPKGKVLGDEEHINQEFHDALNQADVVQHGNKLPSDVFKTTQGWKAIPRTAFDEIHGGLKGSSLGGRIVGKVQGGTAGLILGQNPHFLIMNTLAHAFPAIAATKGALIPDLFKTPVWWHGLSDADKHAILMREGGRGGHYNVTARLGSQAPNRIAEFGRKLDQQGLVQKAKVLNPLHAVLRAEDLQSNFFRHAVMYHEIKRAAYQDMAHEYGRAVSLWEQVKHVFDLGPQARMKAIVENMPKMEELGRTTVNILGDYGRFTARERQFFNNRAVMFYSFLRHVTRTLLYVLPVRHPLAFGMLGELGNLHVEEVKKLLGGQNLPWAYGRLFLDQKGKLKSIDLTSTSPVSSPLVDVLSGGVKELPRLITPALAPLLDIAYGQTPLGAPVKQNAWSYLNDLFSLSYPYRTASAFHFGLKPQQSDSLPFVHDRPLKLKTLAAQQYQAAKTQARGPLRDYLLGSLLGVYPKPDDSRIIAKHMAAKAKKGGRAGGFLMGGKSGPTSGGYLMGGSSGGSSYLMNP